MDLRITLVSISIFYLLTAILPAEGRNVGSDEAKEIAGKWIEAVSTGEFDDAMELSALPLLLAERDSRMEGGKPVRSGIWGVSHLDRETLAKLLRKLRPKLEGLKAESVSAISAKRSEDVAAELGESLPDGGHRVVFAPAPDADAIEIYVNGAGRIVALLGAER